MNSELVKQTEWQYTDSITGKPDWEKITDALALRPPSAAPAEEVIKALRELADGYFRDPMGNKMELTILGRTQRESIIATALATRSATLTPSWRPMDERPGKRGWYAVLDAQDEPRAALYVHDNWIAASSVEPLKGWAPFPPIPSAPPETKSPA